MKRLLYGTTALVAAGTLMTGPAAAAGLEASLGGYMEQWFGFSAQDEDDTNGPAAGGADYTTTNFVSDSEVHFKASTVLDNGIKVQYHVELEGNTSGDQIDESYLQVTGSFGQVVFGSENSAHYKMAYGPNQFGATALSGDTTNWINQAGLGGGAGNWRTPWGSIWHEVDAGCNDDKRLTYFTPRFSGFQVGASYTANCGSQDANGLGTDGTIENVISVGANFVRKFDQIDVKVSAGFSAGEEPVGNPGEDPKVVSFGARFGYAGFTLGGNFADAFDAIQTNGNTSNENKGWSVGGSYATGPWSLSLTWSHGEREGLITAAGLGADDEIDRIEFGARYALGPGVQLRGSVYYVDADSESPAVAAEWDNDGWAVVGGMAVSF